MRTVVLATHNQGKLKELKDVLSVLDGVAFRSLIELAPNLQIKETGETFRDNALIKARTASLALNLPCLADDSGLEVDALGNLPGVRSARFAGDHASDSENNQRLLERLAHVAQGSRQARFRCVLALAEPSGSQIHFEEGILPGRIISDLRGADGFGYDPLFVPDGQERTLAELGSDYKNRFSHRAQALEKMIRYLSVRNSA